MPHGYWRLSSFYFFYFAALGAYVPFWSLFLQDSGFNPAQIGVLSALLVGSKLVAPNFWGWLADRSGRSLAIIRWTSMAAALAFSGFLWVKGYRQFALLTVVFGLFWNAPLPLYEALTLAHLQEQADRYSRIRLWGSVGFILAVLGLGQMLEIYPVRYLPYLVAGFIILTWLSAAFTRPANPVKRSTETGNHGNKTRKIELLAFLFIYVLIQIGHAPYYVFYTIYLQDHLYTTTTTGLLWSLGVVAEIVLFLWMKPLLGRYALRTILMASLFFSVLRWLLIGHFVDQIALVVFAQLLHAATFGGTHIAAIHFVHDYFPPQQQSSGQALYHSFSFGLGGMVGSYLSGQYWETMGSHFVYTVAALCCGMAYLMTYLFIGRSSK